MNFVRQVFRFESYRITACECVRVVTRNYTSGHVTKIAVTPFHSP